ncbi:HEAT repeat domain-containing protein [Archangium violaceum]|uniref:HEAT repeat domain-containing protein n=1 Tax=Archangium violaceum TaxID=83451 RepID=UPI002B2D5946|nr:HEAT repeat domain-containing protein [Archangium gephyra]
MDPTLRRCWRLGALLATLGTTPAPAVDERPISGPRLPRLTCYAGYLKLEAPHGLEGVRAAIRQAIARDDQGALLFLEQRLAEVIGKDPQAALQVAGWADTTPEPEMSLYLRAVRETEAVRSPPVVDRLATLAESHPDPGHQASALIALETQHRFEPAMLERLTTLARKDTLPTGVTLLTVRTLGRVMDNDFQRTGRFDPYMSRLLEVALDSTEPGVRGLAIEMGTYPDARIDGPLLQQLVKLQREDPDPDVREMAALAMSSGRDPRAVLEAFRQSFPQEKNECVRWAIVRYAVRAAGAGALPLLKDFARQDARFRQDHADFKALYDAGQVDFNRVFSSKAHHHRCEG